MLSKKQVIESITTNTGYITNIILCAATDVSRLESLLTKIIAQAAVQLPIKVLK